MSSKHTQKNLLPNIQRRRQNAMKQVERRMAEALTSPEAELRVERAKKEYETLRSRLPL